MNWLNLAAGIALRYRVQWPLESYFKAVTLQLFQIFPGQGIIAVASVLSWFVSLVGSDICTTASAVLPIEYQKYTHTRWAPHPSHQTISRTHTCGPKKIWPHSHSGL